MVLVLQFFSGKRSEFISKIVRDREVFQAIDLLVTY
jgi:hypothetical protein